MKCHFVLPGGPADLCNGLQNTGFIIGMHYGYQDSIFLQCLADIFRGDSPVRTDRQVSSFEALALKPLYRVQDSGMLNSRCYYMSLAVFICGADYRKVI